MESVKRNFLERDFNCAEAVLLGAGERFDLGLTEKDMCLLSAFGGGMGCGKTCGALCGALAAIGKLKVTERAHATEGFKECCGGFTELFEKHFGGTDCSVLKPIHRDPELRCYKLVEETLALLDDYLADSN